MRGREGYRRRRRRGRRRSYAPPVRSLLLSDVWLCGVCRALADRIRDEIRDVHGLIIKDVKGGGVEFTKA